MGTTLLQFCYIFHNITSQETGTASLHVLESISAKSQLGLPSILVHRQQEHQPELIN